MLYKDIKKVSPNVFCFSPTLWEYDPLLRGFSTPLPFLGSGQQDAYAQDGVLLRRARLGLSHYGGLFAFLFTDPEVTQQIRPVCRTFWFFFFKQFFVAVSPCCMVVEKRSFISAALLLHLRIDALGKAEGTQEESVRQQDFVQLPLWRCIVCWSLQQGEGGSLQSLPPSRKGPTREDIRQVAQKSLRSSTFGWLGSLCA